MTCHAANHACSDQYPCAFAQSEACGGCGFADCPSIACDNLREREWMRAAERSLS